MVCVLVVETQAVQNAGSLHLPAPVSYIAQEDHGQGTSSQRAEPGDIHDNSQGRRAESGAAR